MIVLGRTTKRGKWTVLGRARGVAAFDLHTLGRISDYWHTTEQRLQRAIAAGEVTQDRVTTNDGMSF